MARIRRDDPDISEAIREVRKIIAFRNILIHVYDSLDQFIVWDVIQNKLPQLAEDVDALLSRKESPETND